MNPAQTTTPNDNGVSEHGLVDAIFTALASASSFVPLGFTHPSAPVDPAQEIVPRFRGWIER